MTATMFNKEYGHKSPWIGVGAYSMATVTGLMRMANNKHWLSDVLTGAGIGILSTEIGYYLADLIFKEKGITRFANENVFERLDKPSFVSLYFGLNIPLSGYDIDEQTEFSTSSGSTAGVEGAYFFNPYIGAGGRFAVSNTSIIVNKDRAENNTFVRYRLAEEATSPIRCRRAGCWAASCWAASALSPTETGRPYDFRKRRLFFGKRGLIDVQGKRALRHPFLPRLQFASVT